MQSKDHLEYRGGGVVDVADAAVVEVSSSCNASALIRGLEHYDLSIRQVVAVVEVVAASDQDTVRIEGTIGTQRGAATTAVPVIEDTAIEDTNVSAVTIETSTATRTMTDADAIPNTYSAIDKMPSAEYLYNCRTCKYLLGGGILRSTWSAASVSYIYSYGATPVAQNIDIAAIRGFWLYSGE